MEKKKFRPGFLDQTRDLTEEQYKMLDSYQRRELRWRDLDYKRPRRTRSEIIGKRMYDRFECQHYLNQHRDSEGNVTIEVWQRDCDMCEWTTTYVIPAHWRSYDLLQEELYEGAEGPVRLSALTPTEAEAFKPEHRDRAMEAFEDGRGANAYCV